MAEGRCLQPSEAQEADSCGERGGGWVGTASGAEVTHRLPRSPRTAPAAPGVRPCWFLGVAGPERRCDLRVGLWLLLRGRPR